jgi:hypothetical protein
VVSRIRLIGVTAATTALAVGALAFADGASDNEAFVDGSVKPSKLDKKKFKPINLFTEVRTTGPVPGENPEAELIEYDKDGKWNAKATPTCSADIEFLPTADAIAACKGSDIGSGSAAILLPGGLAYDDLTVTAFNGPGKNEIRLHTYSPSLEGATPTVFGKIIKAPSGGKFGIALSVPDAPDVAGDAGKITKFNATISKSSGMALARCKDKKFLIQRTVTYDDGSKETVTDVQKCKRKKKKRK